jgi:phosphoenolpyruvate---glycerone phosphotransferase subunit DhaL
MVLTSIGPSEVLQILDDVASEISRNKEYLTELDSLGGDGDHGVNLDRGFLKVRSQYPQLQNSRDIGFILTSVGTTLLSTVGGATGSLYGAALIKAGKVARGKTEIRAKDLPEIINACTSAILELGGAKPGDKTMVDVLLPAAEAISQVGKESDDLNYILDRGAKAARDGLENTKTMVAKKGRASYLRERTLGLYDVGAASLYIILETCAGTVGRLAKNSA